MTTKTGTPERIWWRYYNPGEDNNPEGLSECMAFLEKNGIETHNNVFVDEQQLTQKGIYNEFACLVDQKLKGGERVFGQYED